MLCVYERIGRQCCIVRHLEMSRKGEGRRAGVEGV